MTISKVHRCEKMIERGRKRKGKREKVEDRKPSETVTTIKTNKPKRI